MPTILASSEINPTEPFCIAAIAPWSCTCGDLANGYIEISEADRPSFCHVRVPLASHNIDGYSVNLPDNWFCRIAGAGGNNLFCINEQNQEMLIQSLISELPLANADEAADQDYAEGEGPIFYPVVEPDEEKISREIIAIGNEQVLSLLTRREGTFLLRYFIKNDENLYVFTFESRDLGEMESMTGVLEEIIASMQFIP
jgi:hypothetical protein